MSLEGGLIVLSEAAEAEINERFIAQIVIGLNLQLRLFGACLIGRSGEEGGQDLRQANRSAVGNENPFKAPHAVWNSSAHRPISFKF